MKRYLTALLWGLFLVPSWAAAQQDMVTIATVDRPPFSKNTKAGPVGFSIDLWTEIAQDLGLATQFRTVEQFNEMLALVETGKVDGAIANISITSERERVLDFTLPIFRSGLQIMTGPETGTSIWSVVFRYDLLPSIALAFLALFGGGMLMWAFERNSQDYFKRPVKEALFPSFWWALNLIVNGGFEERQPRTAPGRILGVLLVVSSLFIVSIFVAKITSIMTVEAIQSNIKGPADLKERKVGVPQGSTSDSFARAKGLTPIPFASPAEMYLAFEDGALDAVIFDAPMLAYYATNENPGGARLVDRTFRSENYGMALPSGSDLREEINQALLAMREDGRYAVIYTKWFGTE